MVAALEHQIQHHPDNIDTSTFTHRIDELKHEAPKTDFLQYATQLDFVVDAYLKTAPLPLWIKSIYTSTPERQLVEDPQTLAEKLGPHAVKLSHPLVETTKSIPKYPSLPILALGVTEAHDRLSFRFTYNYEYHNKTYKEVTAQNPDLSNPSKELLAVFFTQNLLRTGISYAFSKLIEDVSSPKRKGKKKSKKIDDNPAEYYLKFIRDAKSLLLQGNTPYQELLDQVADSKKAKELLTKLVEFYPSEIKGESKSPKKRREVRQTILEYSQLEWLPIKEDQKHD